MVVQSVDKVEASHLISAVQTALGHLSTLKMQAVELGTADPKDLIDIYRSVRRLREYLHRAAGGYQSTSELRLSDDDANLLCSCLVRELSDVGEALERGSAPERRAWLEQRARTLHELTLRFATRPIVELPRRAGVIPEQARATLLAVRRRFTAVEGADGALIRTRSPFRPTPQDGPAIASLPGPLEAAPTDDDDDDPLIDPRVLRDPRLRCTMQLDLRAYRRAVESGDARLAGLHLFSILEGAVIDWVMPRVKELGLVGAPDTWKLVHLVPVLLPDLAARDRALLALLCRSLHAVQPGKQLLEPVILTSGALDELRVFVRRILASLGFRSGDAAGAGQNLAPDTLRAGSSRCTPGASWSTCRPSGRPNSTS